ncbi:hypothetical protein Tco_0742722 [Tanacetum coccineum]
MDDEPMWAADHVVTPTPGSAITILETANEFAIKGNHLTLVKGNQFDGRTKTDPHKHIHKFLGIFDMLSNKGGGFSKLIDCANIGTIRLRWDRRVLGMLEGLPISMKACERRSWVFDLNKSDLYPSFIEGLTAKGLGPSRGGFPYWNRLLALCAGDILQHWAERVQETRSDETRWRMRVGVMQMYVSLTICLDGTDIEATD